MLRPGRIDDVFEFEAPDAKTATRFVERLAVDDERRSLVEPGTDLTEVGEAMAGFVPAFISRAIQKAKQFTMKREGKDIVGKVTATDLILAAQSLRKQEARVNRPKEKSEAEKLHDAVSLVGDVIND
jgi:ATP-dependent 26S proteasome regulatory subunit